MVKGGDLQAAKSQALALRKAGSDITSIAAQLAATRRRLRIPQDQIGPRRTICRFENETPYIDIFTVATYARHVGMRLALIPAEDGNGPNLAHSLILHSEQKHEPL